MVGQLQRVFGANVRRVRLDRGVSQEKCAELLGYDRSYFGKIERGERNLSFRTAEQVAEALGVEVQELLQPREGD